MQRIIVIAVLFYAFTSLPAAAAERYTVANTATVQIDEHSVCKDVTNNAGASIMVPTKTANEWSTGGSCFLSNLPPSVTAADCGGSCGSAAYGWGVNGGVIGDGTTTQQNAPALTLGGHAWKSLERGTLVSCGLTPAGAAYCWGNNTYGAVGDGTTTTPRTTPTLVSGGHTWKSLFLNDGYTLGGAICGITTSNVGYCWGNNSAGQLGDGTTTHRSTPTLISGGHTWQSIKGDGGVICGVTTGGDGYCWGDNTYGQLGDGTTTQRTTPTLVSGGHKWKSMRDRGGGHSNCGITTADDGYCWGRNAYGQLGDNTTTQRTTPTLVLGGHKWQSLRIFAGGIPARGNACGVTTAGVGYCWGDNGFGQIGDGTTTMRKTPTLVSGGHTWKSPFVMSLWNYVCGITTGDDGYCWGRNSWGELGDGTRTHRSTPTLISGGHKWDRIAKKVHGPYGSSSTCGITTVGTGYCWGYNYSGELGSGTTVTYSSTPIPIAGGHTWEDMTLSSFGANGLLVCSSCTGGDYAASNNGKCYARFNTQVAWLQAQQNCVAWGGNLVTINDAAEQTFVHGLAGATSFWIGMNDRAAEAGTNQTSANWVWASGETPTYKQWMGGEPDGNGADPIDDCVFLSVPSGGVWRDFDCNATAEYVCEK